MDDGPSRKSPSKWRRGLWIVVVAGTLAAAGNALLPELATVGKERIAVVRIEGPILDSRSTVDELESYGHDPLVKAIVIRIDSPGGGVAASQEIYNAVKRVRAEK
ncbi:MAG: signal peptide peptidase SppA, partial [Nitrospira sp. SB0667_bin_9]|nr:signal peptide peptidase SppA [Nitrospira sp. SB0667_bin_9]